MSEAYNCAASSPESGRGNPTLAITVGKTYEHWWPFRRETYSGPPDFSDKKTWAPGFNREMYGPDDVAFEFDGEGHELRTIVSVHVLPKPYKPRIFYLRQWRDPDGKLFGRGKLWVCGEQAFRNWQAGKKVEFLEESREENACVEGYGLLVWPVVGADGLRVPDGVGRDPRPHPVGSDPTVCPPILPSDAQSVRPDGGEG